MYLQCTTFYYFCQPFSVSCNQNFNFYFLKSATSCFYIIKIRTKTHSEKSKNPRFYRLFKRFFPFPFRWATAPLGVPSARREARGALVARGEWAGRISREPKRAAHIAYQKQSKSGNRDPNAVIRAVYVRRMRRKQMCGVGAPQCVKTQERHGVIKISPNFR